MNHVFVTRTAAYLPGAAVSNDEMEGVLGQIGDRPSRARRPILRSNGITSRHYAIDRASGKATYTNAQLTAAAIAHLGTDVGSVQCLATGTATPDQLMPGHAVMVHGKLGWPRLEATSFAGICLAGTAAFKHAWLCVRAGDAERAIATGSELVSPLLRAEHFQPEHDHKVQALEAHPEVAFEKDFLRWMLSDGAGAVLLERAPRGPLSLRVDWIELSSAAHELPACMYSGADKENGDELKSWAAYSTAEREAKSVFAIKQDVRLLNENIAAATLSEPLTLLVEKYGLRADDIDWFLPHMSSSYFRQPLVAALEVAGLPIPQDRWFTNLTTKGNTGSASPFIMLDEAMKTGLFHLGQRILMFVPESGRFSSGFVMMQAVGA